jgi:hypothetical protein
MSYIEKAVGRIFMLDCWREYRHKPIGDGEKYPSSLKDFQKELETTGIRVTGFKTMTKKSVTEYYDSYIITSNQDTDKLSFELSLPKGRRAKGIFICYANGIRILNVSGYITNLIRPLYRILEDYQNIVNKVQEAMAEEEKKEKLRELANGSIEVWLRVVFQKIALPYQIQKRKDKTELFVNMRNGRQLEIAIPFDNFQEILPRIEIIIKKYRDLQAELSPKVLISHSEKRHYLNKGSTNAVLYMNLQENRLLKIVIPLAKIGETAPKIETIISKYRNLQNEFDTDVLISNRSTGTNWINKEAE